MKLLTSNNFFWADDIYPSGCVHTEENSYCVADCLVLNEEKLVRCPTVVPGLMKYCLRCTTYMCTISDIFIHYTTRHVGTEESDSFVDSIYNTISEFRQ